MQQILLSLAVAVVGYLLGCISTGILVSKREGVNIRTVGSHNTGASNVLRARPQKGADHLSGRFPQSDNARLLDWQPAAARRHVWCARLWDDAGRFLRCAGA